MPLLELLDETLDINSTENYELSVEVSFDGLSYSILDKLRNKYVLLRDYEPDDNGYYDTGKLGEILGMDDFLTKNFKKINLITPSPRVTLVPAPLFVESKKKEYFNFNQIANDGEVILTNECEDPDVVLIFSLPGSVTELLRCAFPGCRFYHQLKPLFSHTSVIRRITESYYIHTHLEKDFLNLMIFSQNRLNFCNTFYYKTISDIQYYILYVLKKMNISQNETIWFSGKMNNSRLILSGFADFIKTIKFAEPSGNFTFSYVFNEIEIHKFLNLFNITNCG